MAYSEFKLSLTNEELQLPALEDLCDKYREWLRLSKESEGGRKTRSANKKADKIYEEIMNTTLPPIKVSKAHVQLPPQQQQQQQHELITSDLSRDVSIDSSSGDSSSSSRPVTRSLRPRCRTPQVNRSVTPSTPQNQRLRSHMKQQPSSSSSASGSSSNVLVAALNQQHPSVSVTKIRQLLRADSAQKKRDQERERQERIRLERKAKEERAESQKRQLLEERAVTAKQKREQRLMHAAEVRKAREQAKNHKTKPAEPESEPQPNKPQKPTATHQPPQHQPHQKQKQQQQQQDQHQQHQNKQNQQIQEQQEQKQADTQVKKPAPPAVLNETFKKNEVNNIEIVILDTSDSVRGDVPMIAAWARAPHLRNALVNQYTNLDVKPDLKPLSMPVDLERIIGKSVSTKHLHRTSSAVWTPPRKSARRSNSTVSMPSS